MTADERHGSYHQKGGTLLGLMLGLVIGLAVAVAAALFITRTPVPFLNKTGRAADRVLEPKSIADAPDPNKPLHGKTRPVPVPEASAAPEGDAAAKAGESAAAKPVAPPAEPRSPEARAADAKAADAKATDAKATDAKATEARSADAKAPDTKASDAKSGDERSSYLLQAGAFRTLDDAESMRGKLALLGYEARVVGADLNGQTFYRVRVGPYAKVDDVNQIRSRLAENGIEAAVVRQR